jgi:hypothetical protein
MIVGQAANSAASSLFIIATISGFDLLDKRPYRVLAAQDKCFGWKGLEFAV